MGRVDDIKEKVDDINVKVDEILHHVSETDGNRTAETTTEQATAIKPTSEPTSWPTLEPTSEYLPGPSTSQPRLIDGSYDEITFSGRVEVRQPDGYWGTVCDDSFGPWDATVICRMLGYENGEEKSEAYYGAGTGNIWMDELKCNGNESSIFDCDYEGWGKHDCSHYENAGVECNNNGTEKIADRGIAGASSIYDYRFPAINAFRNSGIWLNANFQFPALVWMHYQNSHTLTKIALKSIL